MSLIPLRCTVCGGSLSKETLQCEYCGASFILKDESTILPRNVTACPECKQELPQDSIVCLKCGKILTKNEKEVKKLVHLQNKIRDSQKKMRDNILTEMQIDDTEYVFTIQRYGNGLWVVTDKRLLAAYGKSAVTEIRYEDIVELNLYVHPEQGMFFVNFVIGIFAETFSGNIWWVKIKVASELVDLIQERIEKILWFSANHALQLSEKKIKDPEMILYHLRLKE